MSRVSFFFLLAFVPRLALADLGDTRELARSKYGEPSATKTANILSYVHGRYRIWQTYVNDVCAIAEFCPLDHGPLTPGECRELDAANLPGLTPGVGAGWERVQWPNTVSYQYTGPQQTLYQVMESRDKDGWSRMYLNAVGIQWIKSLPR